MTGWPSRISATVASGRLKEAFACGTAAVIAPIAKVKSPAGEFTTGDPDKAGPVTAAFRKALVEIQRGIAADPYGWVQRAY